MKLAPCPFCGNDHTNILSVEQTGGNTEYVQCQKCGARGPWFKYNEAPEKKWNSRQVTFPLPDPRDERHDFLEKAPSVNLLSVLRDYLTQDVAISPSLFWIGMHPAFKTTEPEELFDMITAILRARLTSNPTPA